MPHIHLEVSSNVVGSLDIQAILETLVEELSKYDTIQSKSIKAYFSERHLWTMGEGAKSGFVHCTISILKGRSEAIKKRIVRGMFEVLGTQFIEAVLQEKAGITLELREMDGETYMKS